jgi:hypothetical protein
MKHENYIYILFPSLALLGLLGCGGGAQSFLQQSGADYQQVEKMNWSNEPSAQATDWTTYMDLNH